jgi:hypothetical protein
MDCSEILVCKMVDWSCVTEVACDRRYAIQIINLIQKIVNVKLEMFATCHILLWYPLLTS